MRETRDHRLVAGERKERRDFFRYDSSRYSVLRKLGRQNGFEDHLANLAADSHTALAIFVRGRAIGDESV